MQQETNATWTPQSVRSFCAKKQLQNITKATDKLQAAEAGMQLHVNVAYWSTVYCSHVASDTVTCSVEFVLYQKFWTSKVQLQTMAPA